MAAVNMADRFLREALTRLTVAVGRTGRLEGPPKVRIVIAAHPDSPKRAIAERVEDHLMVIGQEALDQVFQELHKKRSQPGEGSFRFTETLYQQPWFDIWADIYVDLLVLKVTEIHSLEKPAAPAA